jgi:hypothetical protein
MDDFRLYPLNDLAKIHNNFESLGCKLKEFTTNFMKDFENLGHLEFWGFFFFFPS